MNNKILALIGILMLTGCDGTAWNDPYPHHDPQDSIFYTAFTERPKHLDVAKSYSSGEWIFTNQIYEPPLQYNYLARPFALEPLAATQIPAVTFYDKNWQRLPENVPVERIAYSKYRITIRKDLQFQPHPAFAKDDKGQYHYHELSESQLDELDTFSDFKIMGSRQCTSEDFALQIKRLADPKIHSPVYGLLSEHILGFKAFNSKLSEQYEQIEENTGQTASIDLRDVPLEGVTVIDPFTYEITLQGHYPQFIYWLSMPFFAPIPWEAVQFYRQEALQEANITLDWYPVGTGPYMLVENNPNLQMVMKKNPNWRGERFPTPSDPNHPLADLAGKPLASVNTIQFMLEKESIPYWNKFLQGYYDQSGISSDSFDQALQSAGEQGGLRLTSELKDKGIQLKTSVLPSTYYWGFNMLDPKVGTDKNRKLRQAISAVFDTEEYINIFLNGRGQSAHSPLPPGIYGFKSDQFNPVTHFRNEQKSITRQPVSFAQNLLKEAGFANGVDPKTKQPLLLYLDTTISSGPDAQARMAWLRKQFDKLGINLVIRATQYNRFQAKMHNGDAEIFSWGWNADYPDPENFFFLLYSANGMVKHGGENAANYNNPEFDRMFEQMRVLPNSPQRQKIIADMVSMLQEDSPWIFGLHPTMYSLSHDWLGGYAPHPMSRNTMKYISIDSKKRSEQRQLWNQPIVYPIIGFFIVLFLLCVPAGITYWNKIHRPIAKWDEESLK